MSLRRQVLPSIPQEGSEHPTPELLNLGHHQQQQQQQQLQQRLSATNEHLKRQDLLLVILEGINLIVTWPFDLFDNSFYCFMKIFTPGGHNKKVD